MEVSGPGMKETFAVAVSDRCIMPRRIPEIILLIAVLQSKTLGGLIASYLRHNTAPALELWDESESACAGGSSD